MFAFGPQNRPILVQIRTIPTNCRDCPTAISWLRKTPKKAIHPLVYEQDSVMCAIAAVVVRRSRLFIHFHPKMSTIPHHKRNIPYWSCLQCTPSLTLPPSSLKCLQNYNPNIHTKCFRCFKCFGCFRCNYSAMQ